MRKNDINWPKIIQIIPTQNLWARFKNDPDNGRYFHWSVPCYALMEESDGFRYVTPMVVSPGELMVEELQANEQFVGLVSSAEDLHWHSLTGNSE